MESLDKTAILAAVPVTARSRIRQLDIFPEIPSTNSYLLAQPPGPDFHVCLAESQSAGHGRAGRSWISPPGAGIWLSLQYLLPAPLEPGLNLALAVSVAECLRNAGATEVGVKWPNDILWQQRAKLAGLLTEGRGLPDGLQLLVSGLGLNVALPSPPFAKGEPGGISEYPWTDLTQVMGRAPSRNPLAGQLLGALMDAIHRFQRQGLAPFLPPWREFDMLYGKRITIVTARERRHAVAWGISGEGALRVEDAGGFRDYQDGEVSVRWGEN